MADADTRTALMDAAETAVRSNGVDGFSYAHLSEAVGIRKASIHYHFPKKPDLFAAIMARYATRVLTALDALEGTDAERLTGYLDLYRAALNGGGTVCLCVAYAMGQASLGSATQAEVAAFRARVLAWLGQVVGADKAHEIMALAEGAQIAARLEQDNAAYDAAVAPFRARLLRGDI